VCITTRSLRRNSPACRDDTPRGASWLWAGSASFLCHPPCPVGVPFGNLTYPDGRVGVIHPSAWNGDSRKFRIAPVQHLLTSQAKIGLL
jgi:hypothetical protein